MTNDDKQALREKVKNLVEYWDFSPLQNEDTRIERIEAEIMEIIDAYTKQQVYGFHEYIMGKDIIRPETDQALNYARLHRAIDDYVAALKGDNYE